MNIVSILEDALLRLPPGDYTVGLNAIVRHVRAAIRHYERDQEQDPDTCTDAIYRTNQAYEGSLKEAYRVLAAKDPSGLTPYQIEQYLETHDVVRPRVLTQFTRYRQDYRNPSTHDYKLDFDNNEALLAIVSVCAFAKLLTDQIASKLASAAAQRKATPAKKVPQRATLKSLGQSISKIALAYTQASGEVDWFEFEQGLHDTLVDAGFKSRLFVFEDRSDIWDIKVQKGRSYFGITARVSRFSRRGQDELLAAAFIDPEVDDDNCVGSLTIIRKHGDDPYSLYKGRFHGKQTFFILQNDQEQIDYYMKDIPNLKEI